MASIYTSDPSLYVLYDSQGKYYASNNQTSQSDPQLLLAYLPKPQQTQTSEQITEKKIEAKTVEQKVSQETSKVATTVLHLSHPKPKACEKYLKDVKLLEIPKSNRDNFAMQTYTHKNNMGTGAFAREGIVNA